MFNDVTKPPPPLPKEELRILDQGVSMLSPLTRRGHGPGIIVLVSDSSASTKIIEGVPSHLVKWAEEGYAVVEIEQQALQKNVKDALSQAVNALKQNKKCKPKEKIGVVAYDPMCWNLAAEAVNSIPEVAATAVYADTAEQKLIAASSAPSMYHLAGKGSDRPLRSENLTLYYYPEVQSYTFATPFQKTFHYTQEAISHTRSITHLKKQMGGPWFDLELIWDEHTYYEFADRSVEHTMSTMVQEPYIGALIGIQLTGGVGREPLTNFYAHNFIFNNSADTNLELISRSIAIDRIIDEFIFTFTHDRELDWLVPGIPPTNLKVEVPFCAVVNIRGDRLYHEHISWDQGTVLRQLGLLPEYLPFPHPLPDGKAPAPGKRLEYRVPVFGTEVAHKMRDRNTVPSNEMFHFKIREV
ncbi:uncharacterized protein N0V89_006961 [Didymosphaeria variabile]|uniref:Carboxymethylenebutenolidase n=1 Tax=Didymosphaeria variabile TaxID=1932322 RepID=A0A9W8XK50_9PLEO|nr:uncharacterized protein N0V89_006961 [Didymosphaeria variabile]KAJ4351618.1 hypothetical protein N0V89_006961 [Didymosphaeria variabile]